MRKSYRKQHPVTLEPPPIWRHQAEVGERVLVEKPCYAGLQLVPLEQGHLHGRRMVAGLHLLLRAISCVTTVLLLAQMVWDIAPMRVALKAAPAGVVLDLGRRLKDWLLL